ncbi:YicC/YloC family endoribonuclease [Acidobacteriota bacterium]
MIRSMTGFAEKKFDTKSFSIKISIKSLNHRYLDWNYRGAQIGGLEDKLRTICQKKLQRGRIDVYMDLSLMDNTRWEFKINDALLTQVISTLEKSFARLKRDPVYSVENLFDVPHLVELKRKEFSKDEARFIQDSFEKTLDILIKSREREGRDIKNDLKNHLQNVRSGVLLISKMAKKQPQLIKSKLIERLNELSADVSGSEDKMLQEASYLAQRYDLTEEVERLRSHLKHVQEIISPGVAEPAGKKLDFIAQELYREANTINSKAQDINIIKECLALKNEVESIRQQVQNLE